MLMSCAWSAAQWYFFSRVPTRKGLLDNAAIARLLANADCQSFSAVETETLHTDYDFEEYKVVSQHIQVKYLKSTELVINNASMPAADPGTKYNLGWHRDVIQVPEDEVREELCSAQRHHNSCQINLPLYAENCLQVVPGSHRRPNTAEEDAAFAGAGHYASCDAQMPGRC